MTQLFAIRLIWVAGAIHAGIVNVPLLQRLRVRESLNGLPNLRQIFHVHWFYIVLVVGLFSALCFGFACDLAGAGALGRFLSVFMGGFWLLRIFLQGFYYDHEVRRAHRVLDFLYVMALVVLVAIFGRMAVHPLR